MQIGSTELPEQYYNVTVNQSLIQSINKNSLNRMTIEVQTVNIGSVAPTIVKSMLRYRPLILK